MNYFRVVQSVYSVQKGFGSSLVFQKGCGLREFEEGAKNVFRVTVGTIYI